MIMILAQGAADPHFAASSPLKVPSGLIAERQLLLSAVSIVNPQLNLKIGPEIVESGSDLDAAS